MQKLTIQEMNRLSADAFREAEKLPLVVVLDNVRSQHNVGAVFRTADAFLLEGLYLCGITPKPDTLSTNNDLHKTALGAEQTVAWQAFAETMDAVKTLQARGYKVYAVEQAHHSITLEQAADLTGCDVYFPRAASDDDADTVSKAQLSGFRLVDAATGAVVGEVTAIDDSTANPLFVVDTANGEMLIPASHELVKAIDKKNLTITVDIPEGLLQL